LIGHPSRELLPSDIQPDAIGTFEQGSYELPLKKASGLFKGKMPKGFKTIDDVVHLPSGLADVLLEESIKSVDTLSIASQSFEDICQVVPNAKKQRKKISNKRRVCYSFTHHFGEEKNYEAV